MAGHTERGHLKILASCILGLIYFPLPSSRQASYLRFTTKIPK